MELSVGTATRIVIGSEVLDAATLLGDLEPRRAAVVAQPGSQAVARGVARALRDVGVASDTRVVPDGEAAKTLGIVEDVGLWLNELGLTRHDLVVAVGGGAVTDLGGFVAATYLRGIDAVYVPTTLLGAVDAAIGGKTGVNLAGKNLVGVFRHPRRVVVDVAVVATNPPALIRSGSAEALKTGLVGDPELVALYERDGIDADVGEVVERAVAVKAEIVTEDFTESGRRMVLNYGHTVGHAVEVACGLSHGDAVAVGMVAAGRVSRLVAGFDGEDRQRRLIERLGLPVGVTDLDREEAVRLIGLDKKRGSEGLRMVVLTDVGSPEVIAVDAATVDAALDAITGS